MGLLLEVEGVLKIEVLEVLGFTVYILYRLYILVQYIYDIQYNDILYSYILYTYRYNIQYTFVYYTVR